MRVLMIEDAEDLAEGVVAHLARSGVVCDLATTVESARDFRAVQSYDAMLLDINLPDGSGLNFLGKIRASGDRTPVLMLTARGTTKERITGLDSGADDYLVKPFEMSELEARVRALARRRDIPLVQTLSVGRLTYDPEARQVFAQNEPLDLPRRELSVFDTMIHALGRTVSKSKLLDSVYGTGADVDEQVVEVYVSRLRKRLQPHGTTIKARRGIGYALAAIRE